MTIDAKVVTSILQDKTKKLDTAYIKSINIVTSSEEIQKIEMVISNHQYKQFTGGDIVYYANHYWFISLWPGNQIVLFPMFEEWDRH